MREVGTGAPRRLGCPVEARTQRLEHHTRALLASVLGAARLEHEQPRAGVELEHLRRATIKAFAQDELRRRVASISGSASAVASSDAGSRT